MLRQINVVSAEEEMIGEAGPGGAGHAVPGKPWLDDTVHGAAAAGPAAMAAGQAPQLQHVTIDHADIDLGGSSESDAGDVDTYDPDLAGGTLDNTGDLSGDVDYYLDEESHDVSFVDEYDLDDDSDRYEKNMDDNPDDDLDTPEK